MSEASPAPKSKSTLGLVSKPPCAVALIAEAKISQETAKADHDLRRLVCHINLLESLYVELGDAGPPLDDLAYAGAAVGEDWFRSAPGVRPGDFSDDWRNAGASRDPDSFCSALGLNPGRAVAGADARQGLATQLGCCKMEDDGEGSRCEGRLGSGTWLDR
ncbi:uncharacterized protein UV8b_03403 [Ustilaginoidea virens]|uniref:Uncharacterized protein n=1 Tax=Ustilaginoidea virens TaxID=1159556 RepID=A0A063BMX3_USTVR|nr:uncharacterized protein UV8b_03403 [Ustilaginoidea virens]QUC19162.1 hypothetical protein UV8b_03403 [Ustilaginoidea virens]GAO18656.1 hypothetical protein UVI_02064260 [Ustilaginoidea virens]